MDAVRLVIAGIVYAFLGVSMVCFAAVIYLIGTGQLA